MSTEEIMAALEERLAKSGISMATGLMPVDLQAPSELIIPVKTPLRNKLGRVKSNGGKGHFWKAIVALDKSVHGALAEGKRGGELSTTAIDMSAKYGNLGLEQAVTWDADVASKNFEDVRAKAAKLGIASLKAVEESMILGGMGSSKLGKAGAVTMTSSEASGSLSAAAHYIRVVPLNLFGYKNNTVTTGLSPQLSRTNADSTTSVYNTGCGIPSDQATVTLTTGTAIDVIFPVTPGAVAYAVYCGLTTNPTLQVITTSPKLTIKALTGSRQAINSAYPDLTKDFSANDATLNGTQVLEFDGILALAVDHATNNAYVKDMAGEPLTADGNFGVYQISEMFATMWDNYKVGVDTLWMNGTHADKIRKLIYGSTAPQTMMVVGTKGEQITGGTPIPTLLNIYTGQVVKIQIHPELPTGTIIGTSDSIDTEMQELADGVHFMRESVPFNSYSWPTTSRKWQTGFYVSELYECHAPFAFAFLHGVSVA
jgi:hypothetical protein